VSPPQRVIASILFFYLISNDTKFFVLFSTLSVSELGWLISGPVGVGNRYSPGVTGKPQLFFLRSLKQS
jgi:hypothetical protein